MKFNIQIKSGTTRRVILIGDYAFKFPIILFRKECWRLFLSGLLANMNENTFGTCDFPQLAKVVWYIPGGFLTIMERTTPISEKRWNSKIKDEVLSRGFEISSDLVENKISSFGINKKGVIVAVDYG